MLGYGSKAVLDAFPIQLELVAVGIDSS